MLDIFDGADKDHSKALDVEELKAVMAGVMVTFPQRFGMEVNLPSLEDEHVQETLAEFDADGNGVLSREEFMDFAKTLLASLIIAMLVA